MYSLSFLETWCQENDLPKYRAKQIYQAITKNFVADWGEALTLPVELREKLEWQLPISGLKVKKTFESYKGDAIKIAFLTQDDFLVQAVLMRHKGERNTVCVSTQVGCSLACKFCATGQLGCTRNLKDTEIVDQVLEFARYLKKQGGPSTSSGHKNHVTNVVFMGMGEPFLNYEAVLSAIKILHDSLGFNLGARSMTISTSGVIPGIIKLAREPMQINLAISLHAATNSLRDKLMPINRRYPLDKMLSAVADYMKRTRRKVFFEYILIDHINDAPYDADKLVELMKTKFKNFMTLVHINLIEYNPVDKAILHLGKKLKAPDLRRVQAFHEIIKKSGISATIRYKFGQEIRAGCGQLGSPSSSLPTGRQAEPRRRSSRGN